MAGKKDTKQKAGPRDRTERAKKRHPGEPEKEPQGDPGEQKGPKKGVRLRRGGEEAVAEKRTSLTKRRQVRRVATMVKRLKKNPEDSEQQLKAEAEAGRASGGGWDAQQQATVEAYVRARGMQPQEVLQALVNSMEKTLRKEKGEGPAGQTSSLNMGHREEAGGKPEVKPSPERGRGDLRDRDMGSSCVAWSKGKRKGVPPKTRWKVEACGGNDSTEAKGKENRVGAASGSEEATAVSTQGRDKSHPILEGIKGGAEGTERENPKMPEACVSGVPREPARAGVVERVAPTRSSSSGPRSIMDEVNQQILNSKYKFKEGAPLKEYLRQRVPSFEETHTLREVLTMLKEIIRDNLLFDENNPSMIVGDAPLETALGKREVDVNDIRSVVQRQLTLVEAGPGPLARNVLAESLSMMRGGPSNPRTVEQVSSMRWY
jgi:hypothetical protein